MKDIKCYAKTHHVRLSLTEIAAEVKSAIPINESFCIFAFESIWITPVEFLHLMKCFSERILIIAPETTVRFFSVFLDNDNISYAIINSDLILLKDNIKRFLLQHDLTVRKRVKRKPKVALTYLEYRILSLYISGNSVSYIASRLGLSVKSVYNMKIYAMGKMGLCSDIALVSNWGIIECWYYITPPHMNKGLVRQPENLDRYDYLSGGR